MGKLAGPEGRNSAEEDVEDDADAPDVRLRAIVPLEHLRRDVVGAADDVLEHLPLLEEDGEPEVGGLERRVLVLAEEEEVFGLEVPVDDAEGVAGVHDLDDGAEQRGGGALGVLALGDDPVEELTAGAELHDEVHGLLVLVRALELHDVGLAGEVVHDLHLAAHVLHVLLGGQLPLGDGLACEALPGGLVRAEAGDAELAAPELLADGVDAPHVLHWAAQDRADGRRRLGGGRGRAGRDAGLERRGAGTEAGGGVGGGGGRGLRIPGAWAAIAHGGGATVGQRLASAGEDEGGWGCGAVEDEGRRARNSIARGIG
jgi:hypothetical protein